MKNFQEKFFEITIYALLLAYCIMSFLEGNLDFYEWKGFCQDEQNQCPEVEPRKDFLLMVFIGYLLVFAYYAFRFAYYEYKEENKQD